METTTVCILCLNPITATMTDLNKNNNTEFEKQSLFVEFCKCFDIRLLVSNLRWDFENELPPICNDCASEASKLVEINEEIRNLQKALDVTLVTIRRKIGNSQGRLHQFRSIDHRIQALRDLIKGPVVLLDRTEISRHNSAPVHLVNTDLKQELAADRCHAQIVASMQQAVGAACIAVGVKGLLPSHEGHVAEELKKESYDSEDTKFKLHTPSSHNDQQQVPMNEVTGQDDVLPDAVVKVEPATWDDEGTRPCHGNERNRGTARADSFNEDLGPCSDPTINQPDASNCGEVSNADAQGVILLQIPKVKPEEVVIDDEGDTVAEQTESTRLRRRNPARKKRPLNFHLHSDEPDVDDQFTKRRRGWSRLSDSEHESESPASDLEEGTLDDDSNYDEAGDPTDDSSSNIVEGSPCSGTSRAAVASEDTKESTAASPPLADPAKVSPKKSSSKYGMKKVSKLSRLETNRWSYGGHEVIKKYRQFTCPLCKDLKFNKLSDVTQHIRESHLGPTIHASNGPVTCNQCGKAFKQQVYLREHKARVHSEKRKHVCKHCGRQFNRSPTMKNHVRSVHEKEKQLKCEICGKAFFCASILKQHMFTHSSEKAFKCGLCGRSMTQLPGLRRHIKEFHSNREAEPQQPDSTSKTDDNGGASDSAVNCELSPGPSVKTVKNPKEVICTESLTCKLCGRNYQRWFHLTKHVLQIHHIVIKNFPFKRDTRKRESGFELRDDEPDLEIL